MRKTNTQPYKGVMKKPTLLREEEQQTKKERAAVEFDVEETDDREAQEEDLTPRCEDLADSSLGELLDKLGEDMDEVLELGEPEDEQTPRSTVVLDEGICDESLTPTLPLSITSLISSGESEIAKFCADYQSLPDMEMECGTTGSMPNLASLDVR